MKRGSGPKRGKGLKADPEKVRAFVERGRRQSNTTGAAGPARSKPPARQSNMTRTPLRKSRKKRPPEGPLSPADWRVAAFHASGGLCIVSGARAEHAFDRRFSAHHPLPKSELRARKLYAYVWDPRNALWLARHVHERHHRGLNRIPAELLPASVWDFAAELDALDATSWASALVARQHPATGTSRI